MCSSDLIEDALEKELDVAIFSAGKEVSLKWAPIFSKKGVTVIDNSSAWRMDTTKKLIVPEINGDELNQNDKIIANPNCSTIQMLVAIAPIHKKFWNIGFPKQGGGGQVGLFVV